MQLKKKPETEIEYWKVIVSLEFFVWRIHDGLGGGRIEDPKGKIAKELKNVEHILDSLINELSGKFGVINPTESLKIYSGSRKMPAPEGKIYYDDWYNKMKRTAYHVIYDSIICSGCPFSEGLEASKFDIFPCSLFPSVRHRLGAVYVSDICVMVTSRIWTKDQLYQQMLTRHGKEALQIFQRKEKELQSLTFVEKENQ